MAITAVESRKRRVRTPRHFNFGTLVADHLLPLFQRNVGYADTAAATCRFTIMGRNGHAHNGESDRAGDFAPACTLIAFDTRMQTYKHRPSPNFRIVGNDAHSTSRAGADDVLSCFGLNTEMLMEHFGRPDERGHVVIDLMDAVEELAPEYLTP